MSATSPMMPVFAPPPVTFERGSGTELWDVDGNRYLDFLGGLAVVSLGHANPVVADAVADQARRLWHVSNLFANPVALDAARRLVDLVHEVTGAEGKVFFTNSGAEAVECAIKLARKHGGHHRHRVVSAVGSFHGRTLAALAATGQPSKHEAFAPLPQGFSHVAWGDADAAASAIDATVAAVLIEPIQGEGGVNVAPPGYLAVLRRRCDDTGALLMLDEIQTGMARTGAWFGFQHDGVVPDVIMLAKGIGNGMPIGACWARREIAASFQPGDHGSTYSGTALATSAVGAVIAEMRRLDAPALATSRGRRFSEALRSTPGVAHVRGRGLLLAAELDRHDARTVNADLLRHRVVANAVTPTALRFAPPLTVSEEQIDEAVAAVAEVLS